MGLGLHQQGPGDAGCGSSRVESVIGANGVPHGKTLRPGQLEGRWRRAASCCSNSGMAMTSRVSSSSRVAGLVTKVPRAQANSTNSTTCTTAHSTKLSPTQSNPSMVCQLALAHRACSPPSLHRTYQRGLSTSSRAGCILTWLYPAMKCKWGHDDCKAGMEK